MAKASKPIPSLRWWIGGLLFASTVINYIDRQTLSLLAPYLKLEYPLDEFRLREYRHRVSRGVFDWARVRFGKLMDRIGTRRGLTVTVIWYSIISMLTSLARGFYSFATFRFLLGAGESANWPAATKAVSEWFPKRERALATALFDSGSSIGGGSRSVDCSGDLFPLGMASGICGSRRAGFSLADRVAMAVLSAGGAHPDQPAGARNDRRRTSANRNRQAGGGASAMA